MPRYQQHLSSGRANINRAREITGRTFNCEAARKFLIKYDKKHGVSQPESKPSKVTKSGRGSAGKGQRGEARSRPTPARSTPAPARSAPPPAPSVTPAVGSKKRNRDDDDEPKLGKSNKRSKLKSPDETSQHNKRMVHPRARRSLAGRGYEEHIAPRARQPLAGPANKEHIAPRASASGTTHKDVSGNQKTSSTAPLKRKSEEEHDLPAKKAKSDCSKLTPIVTPARRSIKKARAPVQKAESDCYKLTPVVIPVRGLTRTARTPCQPMKDDDEFVYLSRPSKRKPVDDVWVPIKRLKYEQSSRVVIANGTARVTKDSMAKKTRKRVDAGGSRKPPVDRVVRTGRVSTGERPAWRGTAKVKEITPDSSASESAKLAKAKTTVDAGGSRKPIVDRIVSTGRVSTGERPTWRGTAKVKGITPDSSESGSAKSTKAKTTEAKEPVAGAKNPSTEEQVDPDEGKEPARMANFTDDDDLMCFANSVIQVIDSIPELRNRLIAKRKTNNDDPPFPAFPKRTGKTKIDRPAARAWHKATDQTIDGKERTFGQYLGQMLQHMQAVAKRGGVVCARGLMKMFARRYPGYDGVTAQQEVFDCLDKMIQYLEEEDAELIAAGKPASYGARDLITGQKYAELECNCGDIRNTAFDPASSLQLNVDSKARRISVPSSLKRAFLPIKIAGFHCESCKKKKTIVKRDYIKSWGQYLVLHLDRAGPLDKKGNVTSIQTTIDIPTQLNLGEVMNDSQAKEEQKSPATANYEPVAFVAHEGETINEGHYWACRKSGSKWYKCNDSKVEDKPRGTILRSTMATLVVLKRC
ncbi:MAG: hypothetical protein Q9168_007104 [Polycauliona sp. 1 TL-2023]